MITAEAGPLISCPLQWVLVFDPVAATNWISRLTPGRYKHVRAYGYVPYLHVWLFVDANFRGIELIVAADGDAAKHMIGRWIDGCSLVLMPRQPHKNHAPFLPLFGWCVPVITRMLGLPCVALTPDALFRHCLQHGGTLYGQRSPGTDNDGAPATDRADDRGRSRGGASGPGCVADSHAGRRTSLHAAHN